MTATYSVIPSSSPTTGRRWRPSIHTLQHEAGAIGSTGTRRLSVGESGEVGQLNFAKGKNPFLIAKDALESPISDWMPPRGQLKRIGVFGSPQQYGIQFSELDARN